MRGETRPDGKEVPVRGGGETGVYWPIEGEGGAM